MTTDIQYLLGELDAERISMSELIELQGFVEAVRNEPCILCGAPIGPDGDGHDEGCMGVSE